MGDVLSWERIEIPELCQFAAWYVVDAYSLQDNDKPVDEIMLIITDKVELTAISIFADSVAVAIVPGKYNPRDIISRRVWIKEGMVIDGKREAAPGGRKQKRRSCL